MFPTLLSGRRPRHGVSGLSAKPVCSESAFGRIQLNPKLFAGGVLCALKTVTFDVSEQPSAILIDQSASWPATRNDRAGAGRLASRDEGAGTHWRVAVHHFSRGSVRGRLIQQGTEHEPTYQCPTVAASETAKASEGTVRGIKTVVGQIHKAPAVAPPVPSMTPVPEATIVIATVVWTIKALPVVIAAKLAAYPCCEAGVKPVICGCRVAEQDSANG